MAIHLVLGGARSGKSSHAELAAKQNFSFRVKNKRLHYVATAIAFDHEMNARIQHHQARRGDEWTEHECPYQLAKKIESFSENDVVLIDCLTLWLNNVIFNHSELNSDQLNTSELKGSELKDSEYATEIAIKAAVEALVESLKTTKAHCIVVSNEVGMGIVPLGEVSRLFVDHAGWMNQAIAKVASRVEFIAAGLPLTLKNVE